MRQFRWHEQFHGIPWNLKCVNYADASSSTEFHGIPWNLKCANFADTSSSIEFHGTESGPISQTRAVSWNWECANYADTSSSMELAVSQFRWREQLHGIPWNSIELQLGQFCWHDQFHDIPWNLECAIFADRSSCMEFRGTQNAPISITRAIAWNSMEFGVRQFRWHEHFHWILWN